METRPRLFGLIGFFLGGLIVSIAATDLRKPVPEASESMSMGQMTESLKGKQGDTFDAAFITGMIDHHEGAIEMAKLADGNARHDEIKELSQAIITAQEAEIKEMKRWQGKWGYLIEGSMPAGHRGN